MTALADDTTARTRREQLLPVFLRFSAAITGHDEFRLQATGQAGEYLDHACSVAGDATVADLLDTFAAIEAGGGHLERALRQRVFADERFGPLARNLIKVWFVGTWYALPVAWCAAFGAVESDRMVVVSPAAYVEGLLWPTIGANPPGAKAPGYGTWADPPRIPDA